MVAISFEVGQTSGPTCFRTPPNSTTGNSTNPKIDTPPNSTDDLLVELNGTACSCNQVKRTSQQSLCLFI